MDALKATQWGASSMRIKDKKADYCHFMSSFTGDIVQHVPQLHEDIVSFSLLAKNTTHTQILLLHKAAYLLLFFTWTHTQNSRQTHTEIGPRPLTSSPFGSAGESAAVETREETTGSRRRTQDRFPRPHWAPSTWH